MPYKDTLASVDFVLRRDSAFSYECNACSRCCHNKAIRVGPYEILRLARRLGLTTTQFIERHTEAGGTVLRMRDENDRACIFLDENGCGVHPDRPLACRLYPLARSVDPRGNETFGHLAPHPNTKGVYGLRGSVADYLDRQGVAPFFDMGDRYGAAYRRMVERLEFSTPTNFNGARTVGMTSMRPSQDRRPRRGSISTGQSPNFATPIDDRYRTTLTKPLQSISRPSTPGSRRSKRRISRQTLFGSIRTGKTLKARTPSPA